MTTAVPVPGEGDRAADVGKAVAERRFELGLTQRELADEAGVSIGTVGLLERGGTFPRAANARKIERALQWPRGRLAELRLAGAAGLSGAATQVDIGYPGVSVRAPAGGADTAQALAIARGLVGIAAVCMRILTHRGEVDEPAQALRELDRQLLSLETLIAASLPHAESFDDTLSALTELHRHRDTIRRAASDDS